MRPHKTAPGVRVRTTCRICDGRRLLGVLDLGSTPLANAFLDTPSPVTPEPTYPLHVVRCADCGLVQLRHVVEPDRMFRQYVYFSSSSATMPAHFRRLADWAAQEFAGSGPGLVVEFGSNDGTLLRNFLHPPFEVLGIEPAANLARRANEGGVRTWNEFFGRAVAARIRKEIGPARLVLSTNVLAHIDDVHEAAQAVADLLEPDGAWVIEVPHLAEMIRSVEFDTVYHEHLSYFSLPPLQRLLGGHGLFLERAEPMPVHGGSLRLTVRHAGSGRRAHASVARTLAKERRVGLQRAATYDAFRRRCEAIRGDLPRLLSRLKREGASIVGYGAPAKGNTLLNYCGIGRGTLDFLADTTPAKQGLFSPGARLPVRPPDAFHAARPDYALLLAWNFEREILAKEAAYVAAGGRFIRPIPRPKVLATRPRSRARDGVRPGTPRAWAAAPPSRAPAARR